MAGGDLQCPPPLEQSGGKQVTFYTDAKATEDSAWIGGFKQGVDGEVLAWTGDGWAWQGTGKPAAGCWLSVARPGFWRQLRGSIVHSLYLEGSESAHKRLQEHSPLPILRVPKIGKKVPF